MAKTIQFTYEGTDYTLEFTRRTVKQMEKSGFNVNEIGDKPMTLLPQFFAGSFLAHHPRVKEETVNAIYSRLPNKESLIEKLVEMYNDPLNTLVDEPEDDSKKVEWRADF
jgi:hypothetical protein